MSMLKSTNMIYVILNHIPQSIERIERLKDKNGL